MGGDEDLDSGGSGTAEKRMASVSVLTGGRETDGVLQGDGEDSTMSERQFSKSVSPRDQASNTSE